MRVLFTSTPSSGHFHPLVPLALAAREAGHEVAFACAESLAPTPRSLGFLTFTAGLNRDGDGDTEFERLKVRARAVSPGLEMDQLGVVDVLYGVRARRMVPELASTCRRWRPDIVVHDCYEAAGPIVADLLGVPHACVEITPLFDLRSMQTEIDAELSRARALVGLKPDPSMLRRYLSLCFAPPSLLDPALPRPATMHSLRPALFDRSGRATLPEWVADLPSRPTVYVTVGTVANTWRPDAFSLLQRIVSGVRDDTLNVVVTVGSDGDPAALGPQPDNVYVARYIPQSLLLPRCHVCVSHAGFNTVIGAIDAGLPQVLVPLLSDDPYNARRCAALGLAQEVSPDDLTPAAAHAAVRAVLDEPAYRQRAQHMREELHGLPELEHAVALLERLGVEKAPLAVPDAQA